MLSPAGNQLPSKSKHHRRPEISFPQKVSTVAGRKSAFLKGGSTIADQKSASLNKKRGVCDTPLRNSNAGNAIDVGAYRIRPTGTRPSDNRPPLSGRLKGVFDTPLRNSNAGSAIDVGAYRIRPTDTRPSNDRSPFRAAGKSPDVGAYRIRPTSTRPSNNRLPLSGRLKGVCDTPLQKPNAGNPIAARQLTFPTIVGAKNLSPLQKTNDGRLTATHQRPVIINN